MFISITVCISVILVTLSFLSYYCLIDSLDDLKKRILDVEKFAVGLEHTLNSRIVDLGVRIKDLEKRIDEKESKLVKSISKNVRCDLEKDIKKCMSDINDSVNKIKVETANNSVRCGQINNDFTSNMKHLKKVHSECSKNNDEVIKLQEELRSMLNDLKEKEKVISINTNNKKGKS